jgi:hypothetical protein
MSHPIAKSLLIGAMLVGLFYACQPASAGWSNPFASNDKPQAAARPAKKPPSALDRISTGTKNFVNKTGEALHLKKPQPRKPPAIVAAKPRVVPPPYREKKSLFGWLKPKEPEQPMNVPEWMGRTSQVKP